MKLSRKLLMVGGRLPPDFLELVGTPTTASENSSSSPFTIPLPAHQIGDLLVVTIQVALNFSGSGPVPVGWSTIANQGAGSGVEATAARMYYKIAESATETFAYPGITSTYSRTGMGFVFRSKTGRVPQIEVVDSGTGNTYPALTPSAGIQKYSFLLGWFGRRSNTTVGSPTFPSGYSKIAETSAGNQVRRYIRSAMGQQNLETDTTTPGAMVSSPASDTARIAAVVWEE